MMPRRSFGGTAQLALERLRRALPDGAQCEGEYTAPTAGAFVFAKRGNTDCQTICFATPGLKRERKLE
jgi:hypothetical protein